MHMQITSLCKYVKKVLYAHSLKVKRMMEKQGYNYPSTIIVNSEFTKAVARFQVSTIFFEYFLIRIQEGRLIGYSRVSKEEYYSELAKIHRNNAKGL